MMKKHLLGRFAILISVSSLLVSCSTFEDSPSDKAYVLIQDACGIEKDQSSGKYVSSAATYTTNTWNPNTISATEIGAKVDLYRDYSKSAIQASYLDPKWSTISQSLEKLAQFVSMVQSAQANGNQYYLTWTENDFNVPLGVYKRNCEAVASLLN